MKYKLATRNKNFGRNRKDSFSPKNVYNLVARTPNQNETVSRNLKKMMKNSKKVNQYQSNALTQNQSAISIKENDIKTEVDTVPKPELPSNLRLLEQNSECKGKRAIQEITRFLQGSSVSNEGPKVDFQNIHSTTPIYQSWSPIQPLPPYLRNLLGSSQIGHRLKYPYPQRKSNLEHLTTENTPFFLHALPKVSYPPISSRDLPSMSVKRLQPVRRVKAVRRIKKKKLRRNGNKKNTKMEYTHTSRNPSKSREEMNLRSSSSRNLNPKSMIISPYFPAQNQVSKVKFLKKRRSVDHSINSKNSQNPSNFYQKRGRKARNIAANRILDSSNTVRGDLFITTFEPDEIQAPNRDVEGKERFGGKAGPKLYYKKRNMHKNIKNFKSFGGDGEVSSQLPNVKISEQSPVNSFQTDPYSLMPELAERPRKRTQ